MSTTTAPTIVVIDPEDREQTAALTKALVAARLDSVIDIHAAVTRVLREFANPTLEEPDGLGAVVQDIDGVHWVKIPAGYSADGFTWLCSHSTGDWHHVEAVTILSEGVTL